MEDRKIQLLVLTKLYQLNRKGERTNNFSKDDLFKDTDHNQRNFCYQYLGTHGLIKNSYTSQDTYQFSPQYITGKGIDIVENMILSSKLKDSRIKTRSTVIEKIPILLEQLTNNKELWNNLIEIFNELMDEFTSSKIQLQITGKGIEPNTTLE